MPEDRSTDELREIWQRALRASAAARRAADASLLAADAAEEAMLRARTAAEAAGVSLEAADTATEDARAAYAARAGGSATTEMPGRTPPFGAMPEGGPPGP